AELPFEIGTVGDQHHLEAVEPRHHAHLTHEEDHAEALAGALRVPDDPAALVTIGALRARATILQAGNSLVDGAKLLVTRDHLARLAVSLLQEGEVRDRKSV